MEVFRGVVSFSLLLLINSAGFTTHNTASRRASQFEYFGPESATFHPEQFYGLARSRPDAVQGGTPFPDYLYACGSDHDAGEAAHWSPFQVSAANYIREKYPNWAELDRTGRISSYRHIPNVIPPSNPN